MFGGRRRGTETRGLSGGARKALQADWDAIGIEFGGQHESYEQLRGDQERMPGPPQIRRNSGLSRGFDNYDLDVWTCAAWTFEEDGRR